MVFTSLGLTRYQPTWELQRVLFDLRVKDSIEDVLLLNEHYPVYTIGKSGDDNHLLAGVHELAASGAEVYHIDRGGDITFHGPGQLVGYPVIKLQGERADVHRYLRDLEEVIIRTLNEYGVQAHREPEFTGVWVGSEKIAAIGVKVSHWVTMHGFALNVNTDLSYFERIIPCGIFHKGVTSLEKVLGRNVPVGEVSERLVYHFGNVFERSCKRISPDELQTLTGKTILENTEWLQAVNH